MNIVSTTVRVLILVFVLIAGAITFAGPKTNLRPADSSATTQPDENSPANISTSTQDEEESSQIAI